jgi:hypothetical protein
MNTRQRIDSQIEPTGIYETVVATLLAEASKPINKRLADKIDAALVRVHGADDYEVRLTRSAGMTHVEWGGYSRTQGNRGSSILIAYSERSEPIGERHCLDMQRYLAAKHERNARRHALLATDAPERIDAAMAMIAAGLKTIQQIHDEGENYSVLPSASQVLRDLQP